MMLHEVAAASEMVSRASGRLEKIERLAACLGVASPDEVPVVVAWLSGLLPQGRIGVGPALLRDALSGAAAAEATLSVADVHEAFSALSGVAGAGATVRRRELLAVLLRRATSAEQRFLAALLFGELRQGAQQGIMLDAIARAAEIPLREIRRAAMLAGDASAVAGVALGEGREGLAGFGLELFRPVQPMLAQKAENVSEALAHLGELGLEYKLDGVRIQVHIEAGEVRVYTRRLHDVTSSVPDIVEAASALPVRSAILDGEAIALRADGSPLPFQETMSRFSTRTDVTRVRGTVPLSCFFFDCLHAEGRTTIDEAARQRWAALEGIVPETLRVPRVVTADATVAQAFLDGAIDAGHEGVVAKALDSPYETGARGRGWLKIKPANTLDLVVLAAEWGHGRRTGWLSNLHLGARDPVSGGYVMIGKTFKGLTDQLLTWQTAALLEREVSRDGHTVHVRPELVVEVAFNEVQGSSRYAGGVALRFARVKGYRTDKVTAEADTIDAVRAIHARTHAAASG